MMDHLRLIVDEAAQVDEIAPFELVKNLYQACLNTGAIDQIGLTAISAIQSELGGWPAVVGSAWQSASFSWQQQVAAMSRKGHSVSFLINFDIDIDYKDNRRRLINVS